MEQMKIYYRNFRKEPENIAILHMPWHFSDKYDISDVLDMSDIHGGRLSVLNIFFLCSINPTYYFFKLKKSKTLQKVFHQNNKRY
jgi:hypothetical protein